MDVKTIVARLHKYSSCDVSDALSKLKYAHGGFVSDLVMYSPQYQSGAKKIIGPAYTVKFVKVEDVNAPKPSHNYIDSVPEGGIIFISAPPNLVNAVYGGLMSMRAHKLGAAGTVIDGRVRDLQEHRDLDYPLFARGVGTTAGGAVCRPSEINVPIRLATELQEIWVRPGDLIIADLDGVVCLPVDLAEKVLEVISPLVEADKKAGDAIMQGWTVAAAFKEFRGK